MEEAKKNKELTHATIEQKSFCNPQNEDGHRSRLLLREILSLNLIALIQPIQFEQIFPQSTYIVETSNASY